VTQTLQGQKVKVTEAAVYCGGLPHSMLLYVDVDGAVCQQMWQILANQACSYCAKLAG